MADLQNEQKSLEQVEAEELSALENMLKHSKKQSFYMRILALSTVGVLVAIIVALVIVIPPALDLMKQANVIMTEATATIETANEAVKNIDAMSAEITTTVKDLDTLVLDNTETLTSAMDDISKIDFEGLNKAIGDLGAVVEPMANMMSRFR